MRIFTRTDSETIKKTLSIYRDEARHDKKSFWIGVLFVPLQNLLFTVLMPLLASFFVQSIIINPRDTTTPLLYIGGIFALAVATIILGRISQTVVFKHGEHMTTRLTERALRGLLAHGHNFFANSKTGSLTGDTVSFSRSYMGIMDTLALQASPVVVNFIASLIIVAFIAPLMLPALVLLTAFVIGDSIRSYNQRSGLRNQRKEMQSHLTGSIADVLGNQTLVHMFGHSSTEITNITTERQAIEAVAYEEIKLIRKNADVRMSILFTFQIVTLLLCLFFVSHSLISIAAVIFIVTYLGRVTSSLFAINSIVRTVEQAFLDASKITEILNRTPEVLDKHRAKKLSIKRATIELNNVTFGYDDAQDEAIFDKLSLIIPSKQSVGLVGKSGGGKSTLTHLLLRYMDIDDGEISIDGQNIADVTQDSLRENISYVPQDPFLFHRSLRDNIAYGKSDATDTEILHAAKQAHAMEFIDKLPHGLDTIVGERGVKLSGGQRQRIAIARAILKDAPILILDEATSALDSESEKLIQDALGKLMKNRTSIVIAHRLSTISKLDRIIVLNEGKIVEDGAHAELLKNGKTYAKLWSHQSGGFIEE